MSNQILAFVFDKILKLGFLKGYRTLIIFGLTFFYNAIAWLLDVRVFDFLCNYWSWWCSFPESPIYNKVLSLLSLLAMLLRIDTKGPVGNNKPTINNKGDIQWP